MGGPLAPIEGDTIRFGQHSGSSGVPLRTATAVAAEFSGYDALSVGGLPSHVALALYWFNHSWGRLDLVDRFAALWWSALALVEAEKGDTQRKKITSYASGLQSRLGFEPTQCDATEKALNDAYGTRNELFHKSRWQAVTTAKVEELEATVSQILRAELLAI